MEKRKQSGKFERDASLFPSAPFRLSTSLDLEITHNDDGSSVTSDDGEDVLLLQLELSLGQGVDSAKREMKERKVRAETFFRAESKIELTER